MALSSLWKWKLLMYVTDNGPRGEIGNGSSLMARTEGMNRAGIIGRPWVTCQVILRGWLGECVAVRGWREGRILNTVQIHGNRSRRNNYVALTSQLFFFWWRKGRVFIFLMSFSPTLLDCICSFDTTRTRFCCAVPFMSWGFSLMYTNEELLSHSTLARIFILLNVVLMAMTRCF